jgi:hypothetical protein
VNHYKKKFLWVIHGKLIKKEDKKKKPKKTNMTMAAILAVILAILAPYPCAAETWTVTSTEDSGGGTLREALANANDGDEIVFNFSDLPATITLTAVHWK